MTSVRVITHFERHCMRCFGTVKQKYSADYETIGKPHLLKYPESKKNYCRVFVSGNLTTGALGYPFLGSKDSWKNPQVIKSPRRLDFAERHEITCVAAGFGFSLFATKSNTNTKLYGTGLNSDSQIGNHVVRGQHPLEVLFLPQPINLPLINDKTKIIKLAAGRSHSLILTEEGLFSLGSNSYGQCGRYIIPDENYGVSNFIHHIADIDGKEIVGIECGQDHSFAITDDGSVYSCGWGADGQTGLGHFNNTEVFKKVCGDIEGEDIKKVSCRSDFALALSEKGEVFGWGNIEYGQVTLQDSRPQLNTPTYLKGLERLGKIVDIGTGRSFCVVVNEIGEVYTWGYGLLGTGPQIQHSLEPVKIPDILFGKNDYQPDNTVKKVVCGLNYVVAITNTGDVYSWGRNRSSCLSLGTDEDQYFPLKVCISGLAIDVACGVDHTVILCKPFI